MIKRVLLGIGGTPFTRVAIQRALELCRIHGAELTAVTVVDEQRLRYVGPVPIGAGAAAVKLGDHRVAVVSEHVEEAIEELTRMSDQQGVRLAVHREKGQPFQLMVDYSRYHDVNIFGLRSMFEYDVLEGYGVKPADMLDHMARGGVRPIIAVSEQYRPIRKVLIAYGGSIRAAECMRHFLHMKLWPDVSLRLIDCSTHDTVATRDLSDAVAYCRAYGYEAERTHRPGTPEKEILAEADEWDADMIVLGSSTKGVLRTKVFGNTALHVIQNADRPLFIGR